MRTYALRLHNKARVVAPPLHCGVCCKCHTACLVFNSSYAFVHFLLVLDGFSGIKSENMKMYANLVTQLHIIIRIMQMGANL